jgi:hypothetical protein
MKKPIPTEADEQMAVFEWAQWNMTKYPELALMFHIPNESNVPVQYRVKLKKMGLKSGVPDICLPVARGGYHALYIEMKRTKRSATSEQQKWTIAKLNAVGNIAIICKGAEQAIENIKEYLRLKGEI